jgi:hypothetical protein
LGFIECGGTCDLGLGEDQFIIHFFKTHYVLVEDIHPVTTVDIFEVDLFSSSDEETVVLGCCLFRFEDFEWRLTLFDDESVYGVYPLDSMETVVPDRSEFSAEQLGNSTFPINCTRCHYVKFVFPISIALSELRLP